MRIIAKYGRDDIATVYVGETSKGSIVEFVQSVQPAVPREEKWVLIISTLKGCPVGCLMCDAAGYYKGKLTSDEMLEQIDFLVENYFPDRIVKVKKFKIQFARVGEPAFNKDVLVVLEKTSSYENLIPSISTVAPCGCDEFFEQLLKIKQKYYEGRFQLQFSIHSTDEDQRNKIIPIKKWPLKQISAYGERFVELFDRKITLNFALSSKAKVSAKKIADIFSASKFLIKITPVNPTYSASINNFESDVDLSSGYPVTHRAFVDDLRKFGFEVILSVGELEENRIGSNCGQYVMKHIYNSAKMSQAYTYVSKIEKS
ncbi:radical SAM protein [Pseudothermotoga sp. U03pept]|uniref:radical SAM protein n=1 Tax=Pseudothermotoga sp. U03pept TaxID=3447012 RepID=UPI003F0C12CA